MSSNVPMRACTSVRKHLRRNKKDILRIPADLGRVPFEVLFYVKMML